MNITVKIEYPYGIERIYPVDANAIRFAHISGTKTLTRGHINLIKDLGYIVNVEQVAL